MSLLDLFSPPKPPKPENVSRVHEFMRDQIPPVNKLILTFEEVRKREKLEKERLKRLSMRRAEQRANG